MGIFEFLLIIAGVVLAAILMVLLCTKKGRQFGAAALGSIFTEANKNPKIVAEYFDKKIAQLEESYRKADDAYRKASGELQVNERNIKKLEKDLERTNKLILDAKNHGNMKDARMHATEAMAIKDELEAKKKNIPIFEDAMKSAGDLRDKAEAAIQKLKAQKKSDIAKVEAGKTAQEIYSQFDSSRVSSDIDRILNQFSDYADEQEKMGLGAKASWETSYEAQKIAADKRAKDYAADDYISSLVEDMK